MAADQELYVRIIADASGVAPGMREAVSQVQSGSDAMAAAQARLAASTKELATAEKSLAAAGADLYKTGTGTERFLAPLRAEVAAATAAVEALTAAEKANVPAAEAEAVATEAVTAAAETQAVATKAAAAANNALGVSGQQAALGGVRVLEGSLMGSSRAAASFLSNTLGLGPILSAAFPVIGALALGEVLVDVIGNIGKFAKAATELSEELGIGWLDGAMLQLTGFGEEVKKQEEELKRFAQLKHTAMMATAEYGYKEDERQFGKGFTDTERALAASAQAETINRSLPLLQKQLELETAVADAQKAAEGVGRFNPANLARLQQAEKRAADAGEKLLPVGEGEVAKATQAFIEAQIATMTELQAKAHDLAQTAAQAEKPKPVHEGKAKETEGAKDYFERTKKSLEAYDKELEKSTRDEQALFEAQKPIGLKDMEDAARKMKEEDRDTKAATEDYRKLFEQKVAMAHLDQQSTMLGANDDLERTERDIKLQEDLGRIAHKVADQRIIDAIRLHEQTELRGLDKEQELFDPQLGGKQLEQWQALENKKKEIALKTAAEIEQINRKETEDFIQKWKRATDAFNSDFTSALNAWSRHEQTASQAFGKMLGTMEQQMMDHVAKMILQQAEMWTLKLILNATGNATLLAQDEIAAANQRFDDAKTAAANSYKWASAWGGPPAGVIAAAVAFAAVEAFEAGGVVRGANGMPVPIVAHAGERVLSAGQTHNFESLVNNGGSRSATLNQENHFGGGVTPQMLADSNAQSMRMLRAMIRPEALA